MPLRLIKYEYEDKAAAGHDVVRRCNVFADCLTSTMPMMMLFKIASYLLPLTKNEDKAAAGHDVVQRVISSSSTTNTIFIRLTEEFKMMYKCVE